MEFKKIWLFKRKIRFFKNFAFCWEIGFCQLATVVLFQMHFVSEAARIRIRNVFSSFTDLIRLRILSNVSDLTGSGSTILVKSKALLQSVTSLCILISFSLMLIPYVQDPHGLHPLWGTDWTKAFQRGKILPRGQTCQPPARQEGV